MEIDWTGGGGGGVLKFNFKKKKNKIMGFIF